MEKGREGGQDLGKWGKGEKGKAKKRKVPERPSSRVCPSPIIRVHPAFCFVGTVMQLGRT